jgi:hypothetical protein
MPAKTPWYRLLVYFALGFLAAVGLVLLCDTPGEPAITGTVYDAPTNAPLPNVEITAWPLEVPDDYDPLEHSAQSGPDGRFSIYLGENQLPARLYLRCDGYLPHGVMVVEPGELAVALERSAALDDSTALHGENHHHEEGE